jgi:hypothetical protein
MLMGIKILDSDGMKNPAVYGKGDRNIEYLRQQNYVD